MTKTKAFVWRYSERIICKKLKLETNACPQGNNKVNSILPQVTFSKEMIMMFERCMQKSMIWYNIMWSRQSRRESSCVTGCIYCSQEVLYIIMVTLFIKKQI